MAHGQLCDIFQPPGGPGLQRSPWRVPGSRPRRLSLDGWLLASCLAAWLRRTLEFWHQETRVFAPEGGGLTIKKSGFNDRKLKLKPLPFHRNWPMLRHATTIIYHIPQFWWLRPKLYKLLVEPISNSPN